MACSPKAFVSCVFAAACAAHSAASPPPPPKPLVDSSPFPPAVVTGDGELVCTISSKENGRQKLTLKSGDGLEFDAVVSPIVDGTVNTKGPAQGGSYGFTSHLAQPAKGTLAGVGEVDIEQLETKVLVTMARYEQPGGPGTELSFTSSDMLQRGVYVEFAGRARSHRGETFAFRVTLGAAYGGSGKVKPADSSYNSPIAGKMVVIAAPTMSVITTTTQRLP
jgi:hypothetical protein